MATLVQYMYIDIITLFITRNNVEKLRIITD